MPEGRIISNVELNFIRSALKQNIRLDGRKLNEFRPVSITYGHAWGSAFVSVGETKVLAQVSCEIGEPKATRPNEGTLNINVELAEVSGLDAENYDDQLVLLNRQLERTFRESRCVDLESLCVRSDEYVWVLRVDIIVLNHEGNLNDACSISALAALMHFRRPDVSVVEKSLIIHRPDEKEYIPIVLHHCPVTVTFCLCNDGRTILVDPSHLEETVCESQLIYGFNSYQELCALNLGGSLLTNTAAVIQNAQIASKRAKTVVDEVKAALKLDLDKRESNEPYGLSTLFVADRITADHLNLKVDQFVDVITIAATPKSRDAEPEQQSPTCDLDTTTSNTASKTKASNWLPAGAEDDDERNESDLNMMSETNNDDVANADESLSDSEEETTEMLLS